MATGLIRTEGGTPQGQRVGLEIIDPRGRTMLRQ
nr:MAG TPA: hypothetical protein [Caudoviricetes sp.]